MSSLMRVLLIEDDPEHAELIRSQIGRTHGGLVNIEWVDRLAKGLQRLENAGIDVVLLDLGLPDSLIDKTLGVVLSRAQGVPVVVLSSLSNGDFGIKAVHDGAQDYICKSWMDGELLARSLRYAIERKATEEKLRKITDELRAAKDAAESANSAKSAFLANMSHEIRTPLGAILGFAELISNSEIAVQERAQIIDSMKRNGRMLANLIDDILDLSKVEAGKMEVDRVDVSLDEVITDVISLLHLDAVRKGLEIKIFVAGELPEFIRTDPLRFRQILINIIGNAIKFTAHGTIELTLKIEVDGKEKKWLAVLVRDTGKGISPEESRRLFAPFVQADNSTTRQHGGTGLGLALSKKLAQSLGGDLILSESTVGSGSTFKLTIDPGIIGPGPFKHIGPLAKKQTAPEGTSAWQFQDLKVLLVDDSPDNRFLLSHLLNRVGIKLVTASNGKEGIGKIEQGDFDIVLMDIQMPEMDGYSATKILREKGVEIPIIALTAHAMLEERRRCLSSGFNEHLCKPVDYDALLQLLKQFSPLNNNK